MNDKINYFKPSGVENIPATQMLIDITGDIPGRIQLDGEFYIEKVLELIGQIQPISERYSVSMDGIETPSYLLYKLNDFVYLYISGGESIDDDDDFDDIPRIATEKLRSINYFKGLSKAKKEIDTSSGCIANITLFFTKGNKSKTKSIIENLLKCRVKYKKRNSISIVCQGNNGLYTEDFIIKKPELDLEMNYGESFTKVHNTILKRLNTKLDKGIVLLHGLPGTGKSFYLRYLVNIIKEKNVIYIPPDLAHEIASPSFIPFLMKYPDSIFLIEDAENILKKRIGQSNQAVSNLLNLSDGLLSDCLAIQIIATFNCNIGEIDEALLRKGRLIAKHEFKELPISDCQKISDSLGFTNKIDREMTLADIYNQDKDNFVDTKKRGKLGF